MKKYIKCSSNNMNLLFKAIKLFNANYDSHIFLNKDKTAFRYVTYEKDLYEFGRISDLAPIFDQIIESGQYNIQTDEGLLDAFCEARDVMYDENLYESMGAHHAFQTSMLNSWVKSKNADYGFHTLSDEDGYDKARVVQEAITELCDQYEIPVSTKQMDWVQELWDSASGKKYIATVKPKLREVKFTGGYGGLAELFLGRAGLRYKKEFIQMLKNNTSYIINKASLVGMTVNDRTGSITFHY